MVKRYRPNWNAGTNSHGVHDAVDGEFVRYSDYAALEAQLAEAGMIAAWQRRLKYPHNPGAIPQWEQCTAREATGHFERQPGYEYRPLYTAALDATPPAPKVTEDATSDELWAEIKRLQAIRDAANKSIEELVDRRCVLIAAQEAGKP